MSDNSNPYQGPQADINEVKPLAFQGVLTDLMVSYLKEASPWLRFVGILTYVGCGVMFVSGIGAFIASFVQALKYEVWVSPSATLLPGVLAILAGILLLFPAKFTYNFGSKIRNFLRSNAEQELELAFKNNKSLWKFYGIIAIVYLGLLPAALALGLIAALASPIF
jgi:hypothetical protein